MSPPKGNGTLFQVCVTSPEAVGTSYTGKEGKVGSCHGSEDGSVVWERRRRPKTQDGYDKGDDPRKKGFTLDR